MKTDDFDYDLPERCIAQTPAPVRDECKLLVMNRRTGELQDKIFRDIIGYIEPGDVIVANETRVMPARLLGEKHETGGKCEVLLLHQRFDKEPLTNQSALWEGLVRPGKRLKPGAVIDFKDKDGDVALQATIVGFSDAKGQRFVRLTTEKYPTIDEAQHAVGHCPLPPYIQNYKGDEEMYQTVYSRREDEDSAAAPTAGLHFTPELIQRIKDKGALWKTVELQVGIDTFRLVEEDDPRDHKMHTETYTVPQEVVDACDHAHETGHRVFAVGTTSVRSLESAWDEEQGKLVARDHAHTSLYLMPGSTFHVIDAMVTNFHIPRSTLVMLVSAFSSRDMIMHAYQHAIDNGYRFLSFGDAMLMI